MALVFPAFRPDYLKTITLPDYNLILKEFEDGGELRRSSQHTGAGTTLLLSYALRRHTGTVPFINFWAATKGSWLSFTLPPAIIRHPENVEIGLAALDSFTFFRFTEPIQFKTDYATLERGLYSFDMTIQSVVS